MNIGKATEGNSFKKTPRAVEGGGPPLVDDNYDPGQAEMIRCIVAVLVVRLPRVTRRV
jgi:hypothetical protein